MIPGRRRQPEACIFRRGLAACGLGAYPLPYRTCPGPESSRYGRPIVRSLATFLITILIASSAWAQSIGVFADPQGTNCDLQVLPGTTATFYIVLKPDNIFPSLTSGSCYVDDTNRFPGLPQSSYIVHATPGPAVQSSTGNPQVNASFTMASGCQGDGITPILLYTLSVTNTGDFSGPRRVSVYGGIRGCDNVLRG